MEQNTNRMWWTIGLIILGGLLISGLVAMANKNVMPRISEKANTMIKYREEKPNPNDPKWVQKGAYGTNGYFVRDKDGNGFVYAIDPQKPVIAPETRVFTYDNSDLTSLRFLDKTILPKNSSSYFAYNWNLTTFDTKNLDTSNVTDMSEMFLYMSALTSLDVSNFDTSNVTDMNCLFYGMEALTALDVSNFNTSNVTTVCGMFGDMNPLTHIDTSKFDTSKMTDKEYMFNRVEWAQ
jgi:surface protein